MGGCVVIRKVLGIILTTHRKYDEAISLLAKLLTVII